VAAGKVALGCARMQCSDQAGEIAHRWCGGRLARLQRRGLAMIVHAIST
jgi:hypothetical protein